VAGSSNGGSALNQLQIALDIFVDRHDAIYIADSFNHRIIKWDEGASEGRVVAGGTGSGNQSHQFHYVTAMFMDSQENIYVADNHNHRIQKWAKNSTHGETIIGKFGRGKGLNQIDNCWGLYVDREFNVYVSEHSNHRVTKWSPNVETGQIVAQLQKPIGIHVDETNDDIYVASYSDDSIQQFNKNGKFIRKIGHGVLDSPYDFAIMPGSDPTNRAVIIADSENHRILKMHMNNPNKIQIIAGVTGEPDNEPNRFNEPRGVRFDSKGNLLVLDSNNSRVQKFLIMNNTCNA
jgi:DNA-binding beta-propeller fold protein YncE